jgi:hypothetical protein
MRYLILILSFLFLSNGIYSQNPQFEWVKFNQGNNANIKLTGMEMDIIGNKYLTGSFNGTVDFNPSPSAGYTITSTFDKMSYYIQKLDSNGNFLWVKTIDFEHGGLIIKDIDSDGNLIFYGYFEDSVDIDPSSTVHMLYSNGDYDPIIAKFSPNGNLIWAHSFGGPEEDNIRDLVIDDLGNIYTHGSFTDTVDFDPGSGVNIQVSPYNTINSALPTAFIQKLDKNGNFVWVKIFQNNESYTRGLVISIDSYGNLYCAGNFSGLGVDFDPGIGVIYSSSQAVGMYMVKLDSLGNFIWARFPTKVISYGLASPNAMIVDRFNNVYSTGVFKGYVDFDPGPDTLLLSDTLVDPNKPYIQKYDQNGNFLWAKSYGYRDQPLALATDSLGNVFTTGLFWDSTDLDPGSDTLLFYTTNYYSPALGTYIQKLNTSGDLLWAGVLEGNIGVSEGQSLSIDKTENVFVGGSFGGTVDLNPGIGVYNQTQNGYSSYLLKLSQCKTLTTDYQSTCDSIIWMDSVTYYKSTNSAYFTLPSAAGCDSVICLNLTVPEIDTTVYVSTTGVFSSNQSAASYQWLDCSNGLSPLTGETLQDFTPTVNGSYAVALDVSGCVDTSACVSIQNVGVESSKLESGKFNVYPNPNSGSFMLDLGSTQAKQMSIVNSMGQVVYTAQSVKSQLFNLDLRPGVYLIQIHSEKEIRRMKFVVGTLAR